MAPKQRAVSSRGLPVAKRPRPSTGSAGGYPLSVPVCPGGYPLGIRVDANDAAHVVAEAMMRCDIPLSKVVAVASKVGPTSMREQIRNYKEYSKIDTPYGTVATTVDLKLRNGLAHSAYVNNPFALLHAACKVNPAFGSFLARYVGTSGSIVIYTDETTPGNQHRPDHARSYEAVLWTFKELPSWFKNRRHGWFKFGFVLSEVVSEVQGGIQEVVRKMIMTFFDPSSFNFATTGMRLPTCSGSFHLKATFGFFMLDEKACKFTFGIKGASGTKPCCCCKNVVGAKTVPGESTYLVHISDHRKAKFDPHTPESFLDMVSLLEAAKGKPELGELEQRCGLAYNPGGLLWDPYVRDILKVPYCVYWDSMHCLWSSGSVGQLQINGFVNEVVRHNVTLADLDGFAASVNGHKLSKKFFTCRVSSKEDAHIKAFASETIDALKVLVLFSDAVVERDVRGYPVQVPVHMQAHVACLRLLNDIADILAKPDDILLNVDALDMKMEDHQRLYEALYHIIPKNHYARHLGDCIRRHKVFMNCWAPERSHSDSKKICRYAFRNCTLTMLDRSNYAFFQDLQSDSTFLREVHLNDPVVCPFFAHLVDASAIVSAANSIMCQIGHIRKGDYVQLLADQHATVPVLGLALAFLEVSTPSAQEGYLLLCKLHHNLGDRKWLLREQLVAVNVNRLLRKAFVRSDPAYADGVVQAML